MRTPPTLASRPRTIHPSWRLPWLCAVSLVAVACGDVLAPAPELEPNAAVLASLDGGLTVQVQVAVNIVELKVTELAELAVTFDVDPTGEDIRLVLETVGPDFVVNPDYIVFIPAGAWQATKKGWVIEGELPAGVELYWLQGQDTHDLTQHIVAFEATLQQKGPGAWSLTIELTSEAEETNPCWYPVLSAQQARLMLGGATPLVAAVREGEASYAGALLQLTSQVAVEPGAQTIREHVALSAVFTGNPLDDGEVMDQSLDLTLVDVTGITEPDMIVFIPAGAWSMTKTGFEVADAAGVTVQVLVDGQLAAELTKDVVAFGAELAPGTLTDEWRLSIALTHEQTGAVSPDYYPALGAVRATLNLGAEPGLTADVVQGEGAYVGIDVIGVPPPTDARVQDFSARRFR